MKLSFGFVTALFLASGALAAPAAMEDPTSMGIMSSTMTRIRQGKESLRQRQRNAGQFAPNSYANIMAVTTCSGGKAAGYSCSNVNMHGFLSHQAMGSTTREGNDVWGWTAPNGRELVAVGETDGWLAS